MCRKNDKLTFQSGVPSSATEDIKSKIVFCWDFQLQRQLQLLLQRQLQLQLLLELLLGATDHVLLFKKNADLCQNRGT